MKKIFVISGPGGVGKGTLVREVVGADPTLMLSRSWTTRAPRNAEPTDVYTFVSKEQFEERIAQGGFLEWVSFMGEMYGTPTPDFEDPRDLLLEIELEGAQKVRALYPDMTVLILVEPPSVEELRRRLRGRGDSQERTEARIKKGMSEMELGHRVVDEVLVNDDLDEATNALRAILQRYRTLDSHK